jgi:predicted nucleic acid-binding protein
LSTPDTSVLIAAFSRWHENYQQAREALKGATAVGAHAALECMSVLTRLPVPQRTPPQLVVSFLNAHFPGPKLALDSAGYETLLKLSIEHSITGGAIYDALIALTAKEAGMALLTLDRRAVATYQATGVDFELIA